MKFLDKIKEKFTGLFGKKDSKFEPEKLEQTEQVVSTPNSELKSEINKLNSRISLMTQKMEEMQLNQQQMLCFCEQILFHASGSFSTEEDGIGNTEIKIENGKNIVQTGGYNKLN